jgi:phage-related protein
MAGAFRIAEGYVEVTADESGYDRAMDRLRSKRNTVGVQLKLDDRDARVQLDRFLRERSLKVKVDLDQTALSRLRLQNLTVDILPQIQEAAMRRAQQQLARLTADRVVNIRASVDTRVAADELRNLTRRRTARITADADTRVAADDLALLTRDRTVNVRLDVDRSAINILTNVGSAGSSVGVLSSRFAGLAAAALSALPMVASLGSSLVQIGPAAALAVPALGGLVTVVATLAVGLHGVGDAFKAAGAKSGQSGASAAAAARAVAEAQINVARTSRALKEAQQDAARQIVDAQARVKDAAEDVRDAEVKAAADRKAALRRVADAERDLTDAVKDAKQAQEDLTESRKEAAEQLEDLNSRLAGAQLDERQAVLDVTDAEKELAAVKAKGSKATVEDVAQAQLAYDKAVQRLKDQQTETARLQEETAAANKAGVEGSETVKAAQDKVADAQRNVGDHTRAVRDAQVEAAQAAKAGAESVRDAQEKLAEAQQGVADAQVAAARQVRGAQEALADAQRSVNAAQTQGAAQTDKYAEAMAKLSPNARGFVTAIRAMGPAFSDLRMEVQDRLFRGLGDSVTRLGTAALPAVRVGLGGMADNLNGMARSLMDTFTRLADQGLLTRMFQGFNDGFKPLMGIPGQLGQAFVQLSIAASPAFKRISDAMAGASDRISQKLTDAFESGRLKEAIDHGIDMAKRFGRVLADAFGALKNILGAAAAGGGDALTTLGGAFKELRRITGLPEMQDSLTRIFRMFQEIGSTITGVVGAALTGLLPIVAPFADGIAAIAEAVKGPLMKFFEFVGEHQTIFGALVSGILAVAAGMKLWALGTAAVALAQSILSAVMLASPFTWIALAVIGLAAAFAYVWHESETFRDIVKGVWESVQDFFAGTWDWINKLIIQPFKDLYNALVGHSIIPDLVRGIIRWFTTLWTRTKEIYTALKNWVVNTWNSLWKAVTDRWSSFWNGFRTSLSNAKTSVLNWVSGLKTSFVNTWSSLWSGVSSKLSGGLATLRSKLGDFKTWMLNAVRALRDGTGNLFKGIQSGFAAPIKWVVSHVYNDGVRKMWNTIAGKISSKITLPSIKLGFNKGGVVPGTGSGDTVPAMLTPGERILSNQQVTQLGGHRGIDAMLGRDHPTKTGGNPTSQQERKRHQATQGFASGGIIGNVTSAIGGAVSSAASWAKDLVVGGLQSAARKAITALVRPLIDRIPSGGLGSLMKGLSSKALDGMLGWLGGEDKKAVGGPAVQKALSWVKTRDGLPYQWAGNGNPSWDCSGLMSAIESVIRGERPHRRWATGSFSGSSGPSGWVRNLNSPFMIGITNAGVGHTAGTLAGMNVESSGGAGVHMGKSARGYNDPMFTSRWGFAPAAKFDSGGLLQPGATMAVNHTGRPERILDPQQTAMFEELVRTGGGVTIENITVSGTFDFASPASRKAAANAMVAEMKEALRLYDRGRAR